MKPTLIVIAGPTASGKTELAIREAESREGIVLSCDSLCFYKGMDIGTAKPTREEQARVPHFGIDLVDPDEPYSVNRYLEYRDRILRDAREKEQPVIVVGGSGFYLKSFFSPVVDEIEIPPEVVKRVEAIRREEGLDGLLACLREYNSEEETFDGLDLQNPRRVEKALIRCLGAGKPYGDLRSAFLSLPEPLQDWDKQTWLINRPVEVLQERNRLRVERMLEAGLIEEVQQLRARGFEHNPSACGAIGYREVLDYLNGNLLREHLAEMIYVHTNQLIRKQRNWFNRQIPVHREITGDA